MISSARARRRVLDGAFVLRILCPHFCKIHDGHGLSMALPRCNSRKTQYALRLTNAPCVMLVNDAVNHSPLSSHVRILLLAIVGLTRFLCFVELDCIVDVA